MTVAELIEALKAMPQDLPVYVIDLLPGGKVAFGAVAVTDVSEFQDVDGAAVLIEAKPVP